MNVNRMARVSIEPAGCYLERALVAAKCVNTLLRIPFFSRSAGLWGTAPAYLLYPAHLKPRWFHPGPRVLQSGRRTGVHLFPPPLFFFSSLLFSLFSLLSFSPPRTVGDDAGEGQQPERRCEMPHVGELDVFVFNFNVGCGRVQLFQLSLGHLFDRRQGLERDGVINTCSTRQRKNQKKACTARGVVGDQWW